MPDPIPSHSETDPRDKSLIPTTDDYPKNARTVRRDIEALEAAGYPLVTDRVNGHTRWRLRNHERQ